MKTSLLALAFIALSSSVMATDVRFDLKALGDKDNSTSGVTIDIPVIETGDESFPIDWDLTMGALSSHSRTGVYKQILMDDGTRQVIAVDDGKAKYLSLGMQGRKMILNDIIEGVVRADYAARIGGSTEYSNYSLDNDGKKYDPNGGVNVAAGANVLVGSKHRLIIGGTVNRNVKSGKTSVRLTLGGRF